jgi:hypothetical protein
MSDRPHPIGGQTPSPRSPNLTMSSHMTAIRERLERGEYQIDPEKVAAAIVARLTSAPRGGRPAPPSNVNGAG